MTPGARVRITRPARPDCGREAIVLRSILMTELVRPQRLVTAEYVDDGHAVWIYESECEVVEVPS